MPSSTRERSTHECPYCHTMHETPAYCFAHWRDLFSVTCANPACGKKYSFLMGHTGLMRQPRKKGKP